MTHKSKITIFN